ncbi:hypothetical protein BC833DRAFT_611241 [Globomyces pollinis-pini]|nr:hypothetical protein BC833DRAFT_611241 [Globomyces pollinis-pini]
MISSRSSKSRKSFDKESSIQASFDSNTKEIVEDFFIKLIFIRYSLLALVSHIVIIWFLIRTSDKTTPLLLPFGTFFLNHTSPVLFQVWLALSFWWTLKALNISISVLTGFLISRKRGYSMATYGFCHANLFQKLSFPAKLSVKSSARKFLSKISYIWRLQGVLIFFTPFVAIGLHGEVYHENTDMVPCLEFHDNSDLYDRGYPSIFHQFGISEVVFGTSMGHLRSQEAVDSTTFMMPPQLMAVTNKEDSIIIGNGLSVNLLTECICAGGTSVSDFESVGIDLSTATYLNSKLLSGNNLKLYNSINFTDTEIGVVSALPGSGVCSGMGVPNPKMSVCYTSISKFKTIKIKAEYMTDGHYASTVLKRVTKYKDMNIEADLSMLYQALVLQLGGLTSEITLDQTFPSSVNPIIWWTTVDIQTISPPFLSAGIETTMTILVRSAIQRSFPTKGTYCISNEVSKEFVKVAMDGMQVTLGLFITIAQLIICMISILWTIPWFLEEPPIGPAIKLAIDPMYFIIMITSNSRLVGGFTTSQETLTLWQKMDRLVRVGESRTTANDPDVGLITLDVPRMVTPFKRGKSYH